MHIRNRLWTGGKSYRKKHFKSKCSDITVLNADGSVREVINVLSVSNAHFIQEVKENSDILNERNTEEYTKWRNAVLKRDKKTCVLCKSTEWINVHHIVRWIDDENKRFDLTNGVSLCIPCHMKHHGPQNAAFPKKITNLLVQYIRTVSNG